MNNDTPLELEYARDVLRVYKHIQRGFGDDPAATESQKALLDWAANPENKKEFFKTIVPAAGKILADAQKSTPKVDSLIQGERKTIEELQFLLGKALRESEQSLQKLLT